MITLNSTPPNEKKLRQLESSLAAILVQVLQRGFWGTVGVEVSVQDGTIQHVRSRMEQIVR